MKVKDWKAKYLKNMGQPGVNGKFNWKKDKNGEVSEEEVKRYQDAKQQYFDKFKELSKVDENKEVDSKGNLKDENAGKEIGEEHIDTGKVAPDGKIHLTESNYKTLRKNGSLHLENGKTYGIDSGNLSQVVIHHKDGRVENSTEDDYNAGKEIKDMSREEYNAYKAQKEKEIYGTGKPKYLGWEQPDYKDGEKHLIHYWTGGEPSNLDKEEVEKIQPKEYKHHHKVVKLADENADKEIETSEEKKKNSIDNGYSEEQANAVPNDTLVKDDENADIKTDDASPQNLNEIKLGNLDAKISPDSKFDLSPEMEEWLKANGWTSPSSQSGDVDENAGKEIDVKKLEHLSKTKWIGMASENGKMIHYWDKNNKPTEEEKQLVEDGLGDYWAGKHQHKIGEWKDGTFVEDENADKKISIYD